MNDTGQVYLWMAVALFILPSIVAAVRGHGSYGAIIAVNFLLGWTLIGWLWAFIWSLTKTE